MCYFKAFPQNGAKMFFALFPATCPVGKFDIPGYDDKSFTTFNDVFREGCKAFVANGGRYWCKKFPRCDSCTLIFPRLDFDHCLNSPSS
ncbi:hypothetical protein BCR44DRAFT_38314 [Catenaria anguillulae PL171]|uniref:Uncharacterized protein n=1 Tax=Catenaria anguillulae PL171 TaxID=765915 RepID=A0A1Y2HT09_9FUNG|nr:hypothetical protein BCR44DRAFT_38314 [Catenaria anguillulae PL171]